MTTTIERVGRALAVTFLLLVVSASNAADAPSVTTDYAKASALHRDGRYDEGFRDILCPLSESYPRDTNIRFLFGLSAIKVSRLAQTSEAQQQALLDEAIAALHVILVDQPELVRVRLELARAFFYKEEDTLSRGHFERVLAGDVPKAVKANGQRFLTQLRARRRWTMYMGAALLPDNNLGSGSEDEVIYINFGGIDLPFRRNNADNLTDLRGRNLAVGGGEYQHPIGDRLRLRAGADLSRKEYSGREFDDFNLSVHAGLRWLLDRRTEASVLASARRRWASTSIDHDAVGGRIEARHRLTPRVTANAQASWHRRDNTVDGPLVDLSLSGTWIVSPILQADSSVG